MSALAVEPRLKCDRRELRFKVEFVDGITLRELIERGPVASRKLLAVVPGSDLRSSL